MLSVLGMVSPDLGLAGIHDEFPRQSSRVSGAEARDIQLDRQGRLSGLLVDAQGRRAANAHVTISRVNGQRQHLVTNSQGQFQLGPLRGGLYQLDAGKASVFIRVWKHATAPPNAAAEVVLSSAPRVIRGQGPLSELITYDPVLFGIIIAAAIAIPVAVHNSKPAS